MLTHYEKKFLKELNENTKKDVDLTKESFYSGEMRMHYKHLVVDGKVTNHKVDLFNLQDTGARGKMQEEVRTLTRALLLNQENTMAGVIRYDISVDDIHDMGSVAYTEKTFQEMTWQENC